MTPEYTPLPPELENAVAEIRDETPDTDEIGRASCRERV